MMIIVSGSKGGSWEQLLVEPLLILASIKTIQTPCNHSRWIDRAQKLKKIRKPTGKRTWLPKKTKHTLGPSYLQKAGRSKRSFAQKLLSSAVPRFPIWMKIVVFNHCQSRWPKWFSKREFCPMGLCPLQQAAPSNCPYYFQNKMSKNVLFVAGQPFGRSWIYGEMMSRMLMLMVVVWGEMMSLDDNDHL